MPSKTKIKNKERRKKTIHKYKEKTPYYVYKEKLVTDRDGNEIKTKNQSRITRKGKKNLKNQRDLNTPLSETPEVYIT